MGFQFEKLSPEEALRLLGDGDWAIALPEDYPDLIIPAAWRQAFYDEVGKAFIRWVLAGEVIEITHDYDPPWDYSGQSRKSRVDPMLLLTWHATLDTWLNDEYTGNSQATFTSGCGLSWETYHDDLIYYRLDREVGELAEAQYQLTSIDEEFAMSDALGEVSSALEETLRLAIGRIATADVWQRLEMVARAEIDEEHRRNQERWAKHKLMSEQAQVFWQQHFAYLEDERIEKVVFKEIQLGEKLADILADTDPEIVAAIAEVGLPGNFSNSVRDTIIAIAKRARDE